MLLRMRRTIIIIIIITCPYNGSPWFSRMPRAEPLQLKAAACQTFVGNIPGIPGILVYFPRRFGMLLPLVAMVLREASALMRISIIIIYIYICLSCFWSREGPL